MKKTFIATTLVGLLAFGSLVSPSPATDVAAKMAEHGVLVEVSDTTPGGPGAGGVYVTATGKIYLNDLLLKSRTAAELIAAHEFIHKIRHESPDFAGSVRGGYKGAKGHAFEEIVACLASNEVAAVLFGRYYPINEARYVLDTLEVNGLSHVAVGDLDQDKLRDSVVYTVVWVLARYSTEPANYGAL